MAPKQQPIETRTIAVLVDNEPGVLARVIGLFSGRGYNIASLTVSEVDPERGLSRITVITSGTAQILEQIKAQLARLVPVHRVSDLSSEGPHIARELALVKVTGRGNKRVESLRTADIFRARVVDSSHDHFRRQTDEDDSLSVSGSLRTFNSNGAIGRSQPPPWMPRSS